MRQVYDSYNSLVTYWLKWKSWLTKIGSRRTRLKRQSINEQWLTIFGEAKDDHVEGLVGLCEGNEFWEIFFVGGGWWRLSWSGLALCAWGPNSCRYHALECPYGRCNGRFNHDFSIESWSKVPVGSEWWDCRLTVSGTLLIVVSTGEWNSWQFCSNSTEGYLMNDSVDAD